MGYFFASSGISDLAAQAGHRKVDSFVSRFSGFEKSIFYVCVGWLAFALTYLLKRNIRAPLGHLSKTLWWSSSVSFFGDRLLLCGDAGTTIQGSTSTERN